MTNMTNVGMVPGWELRHRLQRAREMTGLEQAEFATELGVSRNSVSSAERGATRPREITLRAWAMRSGVPLQWIKTGEAPSPGGDGASTLPELDSNQQPAGFKSRVIALRDFARAA